MVEVMEEFGYVCVYVKDLLIEILGKLLKLDDAGLAKVVGMIVRMSFGKLEMLRGEVVLVLLVKSVGIVVLSVEVL